MCAEVDSYLIVGGGWANIIILIEFIPLLKNQITMYIFDLSKLRAGDILLINTSERFSKIMLENVGSPYHHAMFYVGDSSMIHSDKGPGVQSVNILRRYFEKDDAAIALRPKRNVSDRIIHAAIDHARNKIGIEYSDKEALRTIKEHTAEDFEENRQFCTRFVAQVFASAGLKLVEDPDYCSPFDLENSQYLDVVTGVLKEANEKELEYAMEKNTVLEKQIGITNEVLSKSRAVSNEDIQTIEQLSDYMEAHPDKDEQISLILEESGYLEMWKWEREKNPFHYKYKSFTEKYEKKYRRSVGIQLLNTAKELEYRYSINFMAYNRKYDETGLRFFKLLKELYQNLLIQVKDMKMVGNAGKNSI